MSENSAKVRDCTCWHHDGVISKVDPACVHHGRDPAATRDMRRRDTPVVLVAKTEADARDLLAELADDPRVAFAHIDLGDSKYVIAVSGAETHEEMFTYFEEWEETTERIWELRFRLARRRLGV